MIAGECDGRFAAVREAFTENLTVRRDLGAAVCVYLDGVPVVDLWGGYADAGRTRHWARDTLVSVASTTKGITALCAHMLADRGSLDLDAPVARYWPEFARHGKDGIPVRWLLSHRAGLPAVREDLPLAALFDWQAFTSALAETTPWWKPGTQHGYHALTYGYLVGEVVRRIAGTTIGRFFRSQVAEPLAADVHIGLPVADHERAAEIRLAVRSPGTEPSLLERLMTQPGSLTERAFFNPPRPPGIVNSPAWRSAEIPAANGHATARGVARIYGALARGGSLDGVRLLGTRTLAAATTEQSRGLDAVLAAPTRIAVGFMLPLPEHFEAFGFGAEPFGPSPRAFGHWGHGGSVGFADPDRRIGFGYVTNEYRVGARDSPDRRWPALVDAVYRARA
jgi:CubicO group peptidase (beta-lactamase class C family)